MVRDALRTLEHLGDQAVAERFTDPTRDQAIAEFVAQVAPPAPEPSSLAPGRHARPGPVEDLPAGGRHLRRGFLARLVQRRW